MLQGFAQLLIVQRVGKLPAPAFPCVERVYRLLPQRGGQVFERGWLFAAQEDGTVTVADDGVGVVFIDGLELALRLKNETDRDFPAADGSHQLFQLGYLPDVGALVDQAPHMDRQSPAVHIIRLFTKQVE